MMLTRIRSLAREEDGQALVLAALLLFAVALSVLGTATLGKAVHARIELQNAADNAAYSLASDEARAFNFYAFSNRAQVSQYVTILQLLSVDSMLLGVLNALGAVAAVMKTVEEICGGWKRELCLAVPLIGELLVGITTAAGLVEKIAVQAGHLFLAFDVFVGTAAVPLLVGANLFLFATQAAMHAQVVTRLADQEALRVARETSPGAELWGGALLQAAGNATRFVGAHLREAALLSGTKSAPHSGLDDGPEGRKNYARRGMSELVHASRHSSLVYDRSFPRNLYESMGKVLGLDQLGTLTDYVPGFGIRGHTRLHSEPSPGSSNSSMREYYRQLEDNGQYIARYPTGNSIGANFYPHAKSANFILDALNLEQKQMGSVTSAGQEAGGGWICTWDVKNPYITVGFSLVLDVYVPRYRCGINKGKHPWWGITPYMAFDASKDGCDSARQEHCQPDVWVALQLPAERARLAGGATIDQTIATVGGAAHASNIDHSSGPKAVARALAYYHRPGNWQEPPNFFNPFWRAKLAPIEPGLERLAGDVGLLVGDGLPPSLTSKVLTH